MRLRVQSLALLSGLRIRRCRELWCRLQTHLGLDPVLLWLWRRPVATALIGPLAWEPPYATGAAQEMAKRPKKKKRNQYQYYILENPKYLEDFNFFSSFLVT